VKQQSAAFLEKAHELLADAEKMSSVGLFDAAGRTAYLAGFHAAQAVIFEQHDRVFKTHTGVQSEFARLMKDKVSIDNEVRSFLGLTYQLKAIADYESGTDSHISAERAHEAITAARRFVSTVEKLLSVHKET
jgi:uncharacterized protein (UPF0332 family)